MRKVHASSIEGPFIDSGNRDCKTTESRELFESYRFFSTEREDIEILFSVNCLTTKRTWNIKYEVHSSLLWQLLVKKVKQRLCLSDHLVSSRYTCILVRRRDEDHHCCNRHIPKLLLLMLCLQESTLVHLIAKTYEKLSEAFEPRSSRREGSLSESRWRRQTCLEMREPEDWSAWEGTLETVINNETWLSQSLCQRKKGECPETEKAPHSLLDLNFCLTRLGCSSLNWTVVLLKK